MRATVKIATFAALLVVGLSAAICNADETFAQPAQMHVITADNTASDYPLTVTDGDSCRNLKLYDMEVRKLRFTLKNTSAKTVKILNIKQGCPCLSLPKAMEGIEMKPAETLPVDFTITARKLKPGVFDRFFYVEVEGAQLARMPVTGEVKEILKFEPSSVIQLGTFIGDIPWKRTFTITSLLEDDRLLLEAPKDHKYFNIKVSKVEPKKFRVEVSSNKKLPNKKVREAIELPVKGVEGYGPVEIGIMAYATGWNMVMEKDVITIRKSTINHDEPMEVTAKLILRSNKVATPSRQHHSNKEKEANPNIPVQAVADIEEKKAHPLSSPETWKPMLESIEIEGLPNDVKIDRIPSDGGIELKFTLPAGFFKSNTPYLQVPVKFKGKTISLFRVVAK